jgi:excisionase family DNA binding protein
MRPGADSEDRSPHVRLLTVAEVAKTLQASPDYVRRLIRAEKLAAIQLGSRWRVHVEDLGAFMAGQRQPAR